MTSESKQTPPGAEDGRWSSFYEAKRSVGPYPTEWVIRTLAGGNYPGLKLDKSAFAGARILDLSCGDGRHLPLLVELGFEVHATEISEATLAPVRRTASLRQWPVAFQVGNNIEIPYPDGHFDYVLACSSFYYLNPGVQWSEVMNEVARVVRGGGIFVANLPDPQNSVLAHGDVQEDGSILIRHDPFNLRAGVRFMVARSPQEVHERIGPWFSPLGIGHQNDDFYGLTVSGYFFVASRC